MISTIAAEAKCCSCSISSVSQTKIISGTPAPIDACALLFSSYATAQCGNRVAVWRG